MSRNGRQPDPREIERERSREQETSQAQGQAQATAQQAADGPLADFLGDAGVELLDRLTEVDVDSAEFDELEAMLKPFLSRQQMLAAHGEDYYDDLGHELLNENLAERVVSRRRRGSLCTGPFLRVAQDVEHDGNGPLRTPLSEPQREAVRQVLASVRTDRQSLGDGTFFDGITEIHVSSEVHRDDGGPESSGGKSLLSTINPFS